MLDFATRVLSNTVNGAEGSAMSKRGRIPFKEIARGITGISTPIFGVSWNPPHDSREIVRQLVTFLEDRRALHADLAMEHGPWVDESIQEIRRELTNALKSCPEKEENLTGPLRAMRAACRKYLGESRPHSKKNQFFDVNERALGELRGVFGLHLARLCAAYGIDVERELATIFPA